MGSYQYVLRSDAFDEVLTSDHDGLHVGDRIRVKGELWVVESIVRMARWDKIERVILIRADDPPRSS